MRSAAAGAAGEPEITITTDIDQELPKADIVLAATNAVVPFISARHLRRGALVCDLSRPYNLAIDLDRDRPDLRIVKGGLVQAPNGSCLEDLGGLETRDRPNVILACAAETIILALSGYRSRHLCGRLDIATIEEIGRLAEDLGFSVVN
jgi:predicted amino acid dehydrogenase